MRYWSGDQDKLLAVQTKLWTFISKFESCATSSHWYGIACVSTTDLVLYQWHLWERRDSSTGDSVYHGRNRNYRDYRWTHWSKLKMNCNYTFSCCYLSLLFIVVYNWLMWNLIIVGNSQDGFVQSKKKQTPIKPLNYIFIYPHTKINKWNVYAGHVCASYTHNLNAHSVSINTSLSMGNNDPSFLHFDLIHYCWNSSTTRCFRHSCEGQEIQYVN